MPRTWRSVPASSAPSTRCRTNSALPPSAGLPLQIRARSFQRAAQRSPPVRSHALSSVTGVSLRFLREPSFHLYGIAVSGTDSPASSVATTARRPFQRQLMQQRGRQRIEQMRIIDTDDPILPPRMVSSAAAKKAIGSREVAGSTRWANAPRGGGRANSVSRHPVHAHWQRLGHLKLGSALFPTPASP